MSDVILQRLVDTQQTGTVPRKVLLQLSLLLLLEIVHGGMTPCLRFAPHYCKSCPPTSVMTSTDTGI